MQTKLFWPFFPKRQNSNGRSLLSEKTLLLYSSEAIDQAIKNRPFCLAFYLEKKPYLRFLNIEYCGLSFGVFSLFFGRATVLAVKPLPFFFSLYGGGAFHCAQVRVCVCVYGCSGQGLRIWGSHNAPENVRSGNVLSRRFREKNKNAAGYRANKFLELSINRIRDGVAR